jgi:hypothetical protein
VPEVVEANPADAKSLATAPTVERGAGEGAAISAASTPRASTILAKLDDVQRKNAVIQLESTVCPSAARSVHSEQEVVALWNQGHYDRALLALERLESSGWDFAPGITWKNPVTSTEKRAYQDVRIGDPRTGANTVDLDFHRGTGNIFAAVSWGDGWSMNISTDGGASWQETYSHDFESEISMKVGGNFVWVAYSSSTDPSALRMRRFFASTGADDTAYHIRLIEDISPATIVDVAMTSNADDGDTGVYVACVASDRSVKFYYDDLDGMSFQSFHPPITDADGNLDITYNPGSTSFFFVFISYRSVGFPQVWRLHVFGGWDYSTQFYLSGNNNYTAISAFQDTVAIVFEMDNTNGNGVRRYVNTNAGEDAEWSVETVYFPLTPSTPEAAGPDISLRSPSGSIVTYQLEEGTFDGAYYRHGPGHGLGTLADPIPFSEVDSAAQEQTTVEWLDGPCDDSYGVVYLSGGDFIPYFDLVTPHGIFCDGFESGDTSAWN